MKRDDFGVVEPRVQTLRSSPIKPGPLWYRSIVLTGALFLRPVRIFAGRAAVSNVPRFPPPMQRLSSPVVSAPGRVFEPRRCRRCARRR